MKRISQALVIASIVALPLVSHAADTASVSRAQVRAELVAAARAGQYPQSSTHYPDAAPDAATTYAAKRATAGADASYGPSTNGSSTASRRVITIDTRADTRPVLGNLYSHP